MTFSLLGRCARTGMMGAAATTSAVAIGTRVPFARAGVGAVLTQHRTDPRLGPVVLDLLAAGFSASEALQGAVAATPHRDWRQLAVIDAQGRTASFSGARVKPEHGEAHGASCVAVANIVRSASVPAAMIAAFERDPSLPLADRLLAGLAAGDEAGGEFRPLISAALLVVHRESFPYVDLRVDRDAAPIAALAALWGAYRSEADQYVLRATDPERAGPPASQA
ncbi:MAG TPA: DUF1028 domain-containing protein [Acidisphaera sp.]|nr:DUF1028 domain-containing protein [Acidisphaera sp.]